MCSLLQCVFKIMYMHSQRDPVFINAFLQCSHVATGDMLRDVRGQIGAMLRVVCFVGCVLDALRGREHKNDWRQQINILSPCVGKCHLKVLLVFCKVTESGLSAEMFVDKRINIYIKFDVHLTDDSSSVC